MFCDILDFMNDMVKLQEPVFSRVGVENWWTSLARFTGNILFLVRPR